MHKLVPLAFDCVCDGEEDGILCLEFDLFVFFSTSSRPILLYANVMLCIGTILSFKQKKSCRGGVTQATTLVVNKPNAA